MFIIQGKELSRVEDREPGLLDEGPKLSESDP
jgi:hypothetical protein